MPLVGILGTLSARASGFGDARLVTVTFYANATWVCPGGVSNLVQVRGKGSDGVSDGAAPGAVTFYYGASGTSGYPTPAYVYWSDLYTAISAVRSSLIAHIGSPPDASQNDLLAYWVGPDDTTGVATQTHNWPSTNIVSVGSITGALSLPMAPTSGNVTWAGVNPTGFLGFSLQYTFVTTGHAGSNATAFGFTFAGGTYTAPTGNPASISAHSNVSVTPGNSYPIVVPSGGFVSLSYYR